jgi:hypothetical protein
MDVITRRSLITALISHCISVITKPETIPDLTMIAGVGSSKRENNMNRHTVDNLSSCSVLMRSCGENLDA